MKVKTSELPGIGKRYSFTTAENDHVVIILHQSGTREVYHFNDEEADEPDFTMNLTDEESRQFGTLLLGVDYQPVDDDKMELLLKNIRMEWLKVEPNSCVANRKIIESKIRTKTGTTIIGIQRGDRTIGSPDIDEVIMPGDVLISIGTRDQTKSLDSLCKLSKTE
jgi:TrkA domain protein